MKRSWRWYLAWGTMVASVSLLLFTVTAGPAHAWTQTHARTQAPAWTQDENTYTCDQHGNCTGTKTCGYNTSFPCTYWQEGVNQSVNLYFYMDPSLLYAPPNRTYNFVAAIRAAFNEYNGISAWNPYLNVWQSGNPTFGGSYTMGTLPCGTLGVTDNYWDSNAVYYGENLFWGDYEYYTMITNTATVFNNTVLWNSNLDYTVNSCSDYHSDGLEAAAHETGHVEGLGHTGHKAIMYPVASATTTPFDTLQGDDTQGIQGIYPGDQPPA